MQKQQTECGFLQNRYKKSSIIVKINWFYMQQRQTEWIFSSKSIQAIINNCYNQLILCTKATNGVGMMSKSIQEIINNCKNELF